ncbi:MAG: transposase, partial [Bacteroidota bacterium]
MPRGPKNLDISFTGKHLTHFGGVYLVSLFLRRLKFKGLLCNALPQLQRNNHYSIAESILALRYPSMLGVGRIETTDLLKHNGVFQYLVGLPAYPNPTTLRRFLQRLSPNGVMKLRSVHSQLLKMMLQKPYPAKNMILDMDSTVLTLYGKQELALIGYNPTKHGRPSYHPLLCFDGITKDCIHAELRAGNVYTSAGT